MNEETLKKMKQLQFYGMTAAFRSVIENGKNNDLTADELISMLIDAELDDRNNRRIERNLKNARFRYKANIQQIHFDINRQLDKNIFMRLAECSYLDKGENVLISGSTGIGKSYIASALGNQACTLGYKVIYANMEIPVILTPYSGRS